MKFIKQNKKAIKIILFGIYIIINLVLMLKHEMWRDEVRPWVMAKNLSLIDLFKVSKFDGHPVMWHLILMPFAKLGFPVITIQIIHFIFAVITAFIFYFKIKVNDIIKTIILFTTPFMYVYIIIVRNYIFILLLLMLIALIYDKKYKYPYLYGILVTFLLFCPTVVWGLSIAIFLFFEFELYKDKKFKQILITSGIYITFLVLVVLQLSNTPNSDFGTVASNYNTFSKSFLYLILLTIMLFGIISFIINKKKYKEYFICVIGLLSQIFISMFLYSAILDVRLYYQVMVWLFYAIIFSYDNESKYKIGIFIIFIMFYISFTFSIYDSIKLDYTLKYSSGKEAATWINKNIPEEELIIDKSIYCQSVIVHLKNDKVFDISYNKYFNELKYYSDTGSSNIKDFSKYKGRYVLLNRKKIEKDENMSLVKSFDNSITGEDFYLYYVK